jgi:DNA-binding transcriptional ArsR family regulator
MKKDRPSKFTIKDLETLRVIADPLRAQIIELLVHKPLTVKQVAEKLGLAPGKLYYHFNLLEKHELLQVVETRMVSNMVEKLYQASAGDLDVDPGLLQFTTDQGKESIHNLLTSFLDATKEDLTRSMEARAMALEQGADPKPREVIVNRFTSLIPEARHKEFVQRVMQLIEDFSEANESEEGDGESLQAYALTVAFYPSYFFDDGTRREKE